MKRSLRELGRSLGRLLLFLYWYAVAITVLFYLLPSLGRFLERQYDSLGVPTRLMLFLGFLLIIGTVHTVGRRPRP